ncbi:MAG: hypothetical protein ACO1Q7_16240 [Gemmatimonas sp.]
MTPPIRRPRLATGFFAITLVMAPSIVNAQNGEYFNYITAVPGLVLQDSATKKFSIYSKDAPGYINYRQQIQKLASEFSPILHRTNFSVPRDWREALTVGGSSGSLTVDSWNSAAFEAERTSSVSIPFASLSPRPPATSDTSPAFRTRSLDLCEGARTQTADSSKLATTTSPMPLAFADSSSDKRLSWLIKDAICPTVREHRSPIEQPSRVLYIDFPGIDPATWMSAYSPLPRRTSKIYAHVFVHENKNTSHPQVQNAVYSLTIQYWFFYPFNDGGNNHEGDWEHLNVTVTTQQKSRSVSAHETWLTAQEVLGVLQGDISVKSLRISQLDYYFHNAMTTLDFIELGVYKPANDNPSLASVRDNVWHGREYVASLLRRRLQFSSQGEPDTSARIDGVMNNHPIGYIGGDNVGIDQLLSRPERFDRNSHATYPFSGTWKRVGPLGATERITGSIKAEEEFVGGVDLSCPPDSFEEEDKFVCYAADRIELIPDWDVIDFSQPSHAAEWFWLVLPMRWGQPVSASIGAGMFRDYNVGNNAPIGPTRNGGWNRAGSSSSSEPYKSHALPSTYILAPQDVFRTDWGFLNVFRAATLLTPLPLILTPRRYVQGESRFSKGKTIPWRNLSLSLTATIPSGNDYSKLLPEIPIDTAFVGPSFQAFRVAKARKGRGFAASGGLNLGSRMISELSYSLAEVNAENRVVVTSVDRPGFDRRIVGQIHAHHVSQFIRMSATGGALDPYVKVGYGFAHFRSKLNAAESRSTNGGALHLGSGLEWSFRRDERVGFHDLGLRVDATSTWSKARSPWATVGTESRWQLTHLLSASVVLSR